MDHSLWRSIESFRLIYLMIPYAGKEKAWKSE
jgi:hypothetical protein